MFNSIYLHRFCSTLCPHLCTQQGAKIALREFKENYYYMLPIYEQRHLKVFYVYRLHVCEKERKNMKLMLRRALTDCYCVSLQPCLINFTSAMFFFTF